MEWNFKKYYFMRKIYHFIQYLVQRFLGITEIYRFENELLNAQRFNSTIIDSEWFRYRNLSPGKYAVDYTFFYTLYRVLSSVKPKRVLEFGLGQSSKMLHQYADFYDAYAVTVEHDPLWADFFQKSKEGDYKVNIELLDLEVVNYKGISTETFKNCSEKFKGQKYDLIIIDSPHAIHKKYTRIEILDLIRICLPDNFIILMDDYNTKGIKGTVGEIFRYFDEKGIEYVYGIYKGEQDHILITTPNNKFLTTL